MSESPRSEWLTLKQAAELAGVSTETVRQWGERGWVRRDVSWYGSRKRILVSNEDVRIRAQQREPGAHWHTTPGESIAQPAVADLRERNAHLEEALRRHRIIEEHYEGIALQHREIEALLQGRPTIPNN